MEHKNAFNVLVIPDSLPYPPVDGGKLCVFGLIDHLRKLHKFQIILAAYTPQQKDNIEELAAVWPDVAVHCVQMFNPKDFLPQPTVPLLKKVLKRTFNLLFKQNKVNASVNEISPYNEVYKTTPFYPHQQPFVEKVIQVIAQTKFDIIQTELSRMLNLVNLFPATAKKVFVQIESRADVLHDYGVSNNINMAYVDHIAGNTRFLEYGYMGLYDAILTLNQTDKLAIENVLPASERYIIRLTGY